jgi:hypothetical protein
MKSAIVTIRGLSPYSQSKAHEEPKLPKELPDAYEQRTWRCRMHTIKDAAKYLSIQVPGKGKTTYTKHFDAGVMVPDGIVLPVLAKDADFDRLFVPSDGRPGGGRRVWKWFPRIDEWGGSFTCFVFDDIITEGVFKQVLGAAGQIIGLGRFRPRNRGFYGRFAVDRIVWRSEEETLAGMAG